MKRAFILILLFFYSSLFGQNLDNIYNKIESKLKKDNTYLNIHSINFKPEQKDLALLSNIPLTDDKKPYTFKVSDFIDYNFVVLIEGVEIDSMILLYVNEVENKAASSTEFITSNTSEDNQILENTVISFKDMQELYYENPQFYTQLFGIVEKILRGDPQAKKSMLKINVDEQIKKSKGISGKNNQDFLNFQRANSIHTYPKDQKTGVTSSRRRTQESSSAEYKIDASFTHATFNHKAMAFPFGDISAELNFGNKATNTLPFESMTTALGVRARIGISGKTIDHLNDFQLDGRLMGRIRMNTNGLTKSLPFISATPKLHLGSGFIFDINLTRAFGLPFLNLYVASGSKDVANPYVKIGPSDSATSYFSFTQLESSMSFYWNTSEDMTIRFRLDLGLSKYDVVKAVYHKGTSTSMIYNQILPFAVLYFNFVPNDDFFAANVKLFDSKINLGAWFKFLQLSGGHTFRFDFSYISAPIFRNPHEWETDGAGTLLQVRYRYGF
ncbi:MAG: hypothetical protein KF721_10570 [Ignavibacteriaceae bacterium]|nr:hypothetical protein [Ignavibacteriaceae bacterium]